ncbi:MAG TPA: SMP-30/gluconolactonase/LRE family protein [Acidobacteriota bacterium]|nr:SMP-30/gluconolactonase/LRE family protein [Acidobacteriota bacterium]
MKAFSSRWIQVAAVLVLALLLFLLWPSPIDSAAYEAPPPPPLTGALEPNGSLRSVQHIAEGQVPGGEDVAVDSQGRLYAGTADGRILRITLRPQDGDQVEVFAKGLGRPLGLHFDAQERLVVADADLGLLRLDARGKAEVLSTQAEGLPFAFTDDLDIARDGRIFFSDASSKWSQPDYMLDLLEARPYGRLLVYDPRSGETRVVLDGLYFANGVALSMNEDFVAVNETYRFRIHRCWLKGPSAGTCDMLAQDLPGYPDGIASDRRGQLWVAIFSLRNPQIDFFQRHPFLKDQLAKLPRALFPGPQPYGLVLVLNERGELQHSLHDPGGVRTRGVTSVQPHGGFLYLGTLEEDYLARLPW